MLGELISEGQGKRTVRRVLETAPQLKIEASFEEQIKILGVDAMQIGTYVAHPKPDNTFDALGQGVVATVAGEIVTWQGVGAGKLGAGGAVSYRGAITFTTSAAKFTSLNSIAGVFEFEVAADGTTRSKTWAWK